MARVTPEQLRAVPNSVFAGTAVNVDAAELLAILVSGTNPDGTSFTLPVAALPQAVDWTVDSGDGAANTAVTATRAAPGPGLALHVGFIVASFSAAPAAAALLTLESPSGTVLLAQRITPATPDPITLALPIKAPTDQAVVARLAAGGAGVVGRVGVAGYTL